VGHIKQEITFDSSGDTIKGVLFLPVSNKKAPVLIICHAAMDFKENYFELCRHLVCRGIAALALDMHGNGQSRGKRFHVNIGCWVNDIVSAIDYLIWRQSPRIQEMWSNFPLPGAADSFMVDTIKRVGNILSPVMVLHGSDDKVDTPENAYMLFDALSCIKDIRVIPQSGHLALLDTNKAMVMELISGWALRYLGEGKDPRYI